jgi:hypothetical protein
MQRQDTCGIYGTFVPRARPYRDTLLVPRFGGALRLRYHQQSLSEPYCHITWCALAKA